MAIAEELSWAFVRLSKVSRARDAVSGFVD
jgi:hypothetical protein